jgi:hypothetical protein
MDPKIDVNSNIDLVSWSTTNDSFFKKENHVMQNHSHGIFMKNIINGTIVMDCKVDLAKPKYLVVNKKIHNLYLSINHYKIFCIPIQFIEKLIGKSLIIETERNETTRNMEYTYTIPWQYFSNDYLFPCMINTFIYSFEYNSHNPTDTDLQGYMIFESITLNNDIQQNLYEKNIEIICRQLYSQEIYLDNSKLECKNIKLPSFGIQNGFFIDGLCVSNIDMIKLMFNGIPRMLIESNKIIRLVCHKITDTLLYVPLNNKQWDHFTYESGTNYSRINDIYISVQLREKHIDNSFILRSLIANKIAYYNRFGIKYIPNDKNMDLDIYEFYKNQEQKIQIEELLHSTTGYNLIRNIIEYIDYTVNFTPKHRK